MDGISTFLDALCGTAGAARLNAASVLADWLEERGELDVAAQVRTEVAAARERAAEWAQSWSGNRERAARRTPAIKFACCSWIG